MAITYMTPCTTCGKPTPHHVLDTGKDVHGEYQTVECAIAKCRTQVKV